MSVGILGFPGKYIQGPGALDQLGEVAADLGTQALVMADALVLGLIGDRIKQSPHIVAVSPEFETFGGECTQDEIGRIAHIARSYGADLIIAAGGGKALDAGKCVADETGADIITVPTIASTDGPVSSVAVEYDENHVIVAAHRFARAPLATLVDSQVIAAAPPRLLASGMGDALATWIEARANAEAGRDNLHGGAITETALLLARRCYDLILAHGRTAMAANARGEVTDDLERVIEANVFLSGVGFQNTGVAGAHALDGAIGHFNPTTPSQHGERVGVGILMQLTLEGRTDDLAELRAFYADTGMPATLSALGLPDLSDDDLSRLAALVLRDGSPIHNMGIALSHEAVRAALTALR